MKGALGNIMKQAQKMQENLQKAQEEIAAMEITGESGGGLVSVTVTGRYEVKRLRIDDSLVGDDKVKCLGVVFEELQGLCGALCGCHLIAKRGQHAAADFPQRCLIVNQQQFDSITFFSLICAHRPAS